MREQFQHVIEKTNASGNFVASAPIDVEPQTNLGFFRVPLNQSLSHRVTLAVIPAFSSASGSVRTSRSFCSADPSVMRTHPAHPGSPERSRTRIPCSRIAVMNAELDGPRCISTKFARLGQ